MNASLAVKAKLACLYAGAVWGLFWIPPRALEEVGIHGLWITVVYFLIPTICLIPVTLKRWKHVKMGVFGFSLGKVITVFNTVILHS